MEELCWSGAQRQAQVRCRAEEVTEEAGSVAAGSVVDSLARTWKTSQLPSCQVSSLKWFGKHSGRNHIWDSFVLSSSQQSEKDDNNLRSLSDKIFAQIRSGMDRPKVELPANKEKVKR